MISPDYARHLARYNRWMNERIYTASETLSDAERKADLGAFFKSIHSTMNHLLWADYTWIGRFTKGTALEKSYPRAGVGADLHDDWDDLKAARAAMDTDIEAWAARLDVEWLRSYFTWHSAIANTTHTKPAWILAAHLFNHQSHHRGQVTTLLMQRGIDPGVTDLPMMPD